MKLAKTAIVASIACVLVVTTLAQSPKSKKAEGQGRTIGIDEEMTREAQKLADQYWSGLTKCGTSYFLRADDRLFEFKDEPRFNFSGEALRRRALSRVDVLNGVDPLPVEWEGRTTVSFDVCRMNTSVRELPASYGGGRTFWDGWGRWRNQGCGFETGISRSKGKWSIGSLTKLTCDDLIGWGLIPKTPPAAASSETGALPIVRDNDPLLNSYVMFSLRPLTEVSSPISDNLSDEAIGIIKKRLNLLHVAPFKIERGIERGRDLSTVTVLLKLPSTADRSRVMSLINIRGRLGLVHLLTKPGAEQAVQTYATKSDAIDALTGMTPQNRILLEHVTPLVEGGPGVQQETEWIIGEAPPIVSVDGWLGCEPVSEGSNNKVTVKCSLNNNGARSLDAWMQANPKQWIGIVTDGDLMAKYLNPIKTGFQITFDDRRMADDFLILTKSGALPVRVKIESTGTVAKSQR